MEEIKKIIKIIDDSILEDSKNSITSGGIIKDTYNEEIFNYRDIILNSKDWLSNYQIKLSKETGIGNLRIKFTSASGYFIEISKSQVSKVLPNFIHKQTLVNASRYITVELKEFEQKLLEAERILAEKEYEIFLEIRAVILSKFEAIKKVDHKIAYIDFVCSLSYVSLNNDYCRPMIGQKPEINIVGGRHPVIENIEKDFISNELILNNNDYIHIITGPNMGGKSTYLRQNSLIILMAHIGSFVPAKEVKISVIDKLFSRVGASDNLFLGQSTFMVEMQEMANIINNSTEKSFIIIDEIGRGTSTYDGISLAWSILKYIHSNIKAKTLFATHYHELIDESLSLKGVSNYSVAVGENDKNLVFLRKIIPGGIKKSFGIEVAKIAGINDSILKEARNMLKNLELEHHKLKGNQLSLEDFSLNQIKVKSESLSYLENELKNLDINSLTPLDAMIKISHWKKKI
ncbi:DNA mismatch repair protein MutS [Candidatus Gracilibacteria bacterium]|nr:MAG: DNA mismatch repair protein MutS [Candidatus Gracilibacteria bacterium]